MSHRPDTTSGELPFGEPAFARVFGRPRPRWFNIPAHRPFVEDLARGLVEILSPAGTTTTTVSAETLREAGISPQHLPLWSMGEPAAVLALSNAKAVSAGLTLRTLADTAQDTAAWLSGLAAPNHWLSPEREAEILN